MSNNMKEQSNSRVEVTDFFAGGNERRAEMEPLAQPECKCTCSCGGGTDSGTEVRKEARVEHGY